MNINFVSLNSLSADIIFLQETHIRPNEQLRLGANWISQVYQATFSSKARGVAILLKKKKKKETISIRSHSVMTNPAARYINVLGYINNFPITCVNVYGPNMDDPGFFRRQFGLILETSTTNIIIA